MIDEDYILWPQSLPDVGLNPAFMLSITAGEDGTVSPPTMVLTGTVVLQPGSASVYQSNTQAVRLNGLFDLITQTFQNGAYVTANLLDGGGNIVSGLQNILLSYVSGTNGNYLGFVSGSFNPSAGNYTLVVDGTIGSAGRINFQLPFPVKARVN